MGAFSTAFKQFFNMIAVFFGAFERIAKTADNLAMVAEKSSEVYAEEATFNLAEKRAQLERTRKLRVAQETAEDAKLLTA